MSDIHFEVEGDVVVKYTPIPIIGKTHDYKVEAVMTKEIFQECYKKWIESPESEVKNEHVHGLS